MSSATWLTYFTLNSIAPREIPWRLGADLPQDETAYLVGSLREFQIGENSEGRRLRLAARAWTSRHDDPDYLLALDYFIAEEQRHAAELASFLGLNGFEVAKRNDADWVFRLLRHRTGTLEVMLSVLLTAEIVGFAYYGAVRRATKSALLRAICDTFLRDEAAHLLFHIERLGRMRQRRSRAAMALTRATCRTLLAGTCVVVWRRHGEVLRRGGLSFRTFLAACLGRLELATQPWVAGDQKRRESGALAAHPPVLIS